MDSNRKSAEAMSRLILRLEIPIWLAYGLLTGSGHWAAGVAAALIATLALVGFQVVRHLQVKLMSWTMLAYFALAAVATFIVGSGSFPLYSLLVIWSMYTVVAWTSIALGRPFSLQYARESTPAEYWGVPVFLRTNQIISVVWGLAFAINIGFVLLAAHPSVHSLWVAVVPPILMMVAATVFTERYTRIVRARYAMP